MKGDDKMIIYLYWAVKKGNPSWAEELIIESEERLNLSEFKKIMNEKGYDRVRESVLDFEKEKVDFVKII